VLPYVSLKIKYVEGNNITNLARKVLPTAVPIEGEKMFLNRKKVLVCRVRLNREGSQIIASVIMTPVT